MNMSILWHGGPNTLETTNKDGTNPTDALDPRPLDTLQNWKIIARWNLTLKLCLEICHNWKPNLRRDVAPKTHAAHSQMEIKLTDTRKTVNNQPQIVVFVRWVRGCNCGHGVGGGFLHQSDPCATNLKNSMVLPQSYKPDIHSVSDKDTKNFALKCQCAKNEFLQPSD